MKKSILVIGIIISLSSLGLNPHQVSAENPNDSWTPSFITDRNTSSSCNSYDKTSDLNGIWINSLAGVKNGNSGGEEQCLKESTCDGLEIEFIAELGEGEDLKNVYMEPSPEGNDYIISENNDLTVECNEDENKCYFGEEEVSCEKTSSENSNPQFDTKKCRFLKSRKIKIKETFSPIDEPISDAEQWYCPDPDKSFEEDSPYNPQNASDIYNNIGPSENELYRDCSLRVFALMKACTSNLGTKSKATNSAEKKHNDFINDEEERISCEMLGATGETPEKCLSREKDKLNYLWNEIKGLTFKEINDESNVDSFSENKKNAFTQAKSWITSNEKEEDTSYLSQYTRQEAYKKWNSDENKTNKENILGTKRAAKVAEFKAKRLVNYLQRRNLDLNLAVSINQTKKVKVSERLTFIDGFSKEGNLTIFHSQDTESINAVDKFIRLAIQVMGTLAVLILIISGVMMIVSQGDENALEKAKSVFTYTIIGLAIGFLSYTIVRFIIDTLLA